MQLLTRYLKRSDVRTSEHVCVYLGGGAPGPMKHAIMYLKRTSEQKSDFSFRLLCERVDCVEKGSCFQKKGSCVYTKGRFSTNRRCYV